VIDVALAEEQKVNHYNTDNNNNNFSQQEFNKLNKNKNPLAK